MGTTNGNGEVQTKKYTAKDFASDQDVRWCPGCGDYSILAQVQRILPELDTPKEKHVFISGIGCSSRFPYYMDAYGVHGIHGRAPAIASGVKTANPDLTVWVASGDGDALSIGGNHLIHTLRRNIGLKILMFNNRIYGLTKGQYSPTSELGKKTKSTPFGTIDYPFNPVQLALGAEGTFVARSLDRDPKHLQQVLLRAARHKGTAFIEIYQNCNVFNDGAFLLLTEKETKPDNVLYLEHGKPLVFGKENDKGIRLNGFSPEVVSLKDGKISVNDLPIYDEKSFDMAVLLATLSDRPGFPTPIGVFFATERKAYEDMMVSQIQEVTKKRGAGDLDKLLKSGNTWVVSAN
ncbi:MAG TPA: 2-oxoacid:ferredoxin oxidoreductase subunit beta [Candidatus Kryptobacter bacterium]|nr:MAG: 2-oxoacid:ferredoxin oxidoreductase subunit beta [Ignavibacteriae bacterium 37-53-5]HQT90701.1 2-oxoacid:ferredoxin oxidoreductase subunit beta [Candidatus Kryptobacter bacterium]